MAEIGVLVRHAYNQFHQATDDLRGTDVYGTFDNDPQSLNTWSIQFDNVLDSNGSTLFMFSNGDCSEWMVVKNDQFYTEFGANVSRHIIASHYDIDYSAKWQNRGPSMAPEDPWISFKDFPEDNYETILYGENNGGGAALNRFNNVDKSVNTWISLVFALIIFVFSTVYTHEIVFFFVTTEIEEYHVGESTQNYASSKNYCLSLGSSLSSIHSNISQYKAKLQCQSATYGTSSSCWIGMDDIDNEGTFKWVDGSTTDYGFVGNDSTNPTGIHPWHPGEPSNGHGGPEEDCIVLNPSAHLYNWNDIPCGYDLYLPLCNKVENPIEQCLLNNDRKIHAWYDGSSIEIENNLWRDKSGNNNNGTIEVSTGIELFDGTDTSNFELYLKNQPIVTGTYQSKISFNVQLNPSNHTVFNLAKYRDGAAYKYRILISYGQATFGFSSGCSGVGADPYFITPDGWTDRFGENWLLSSQQNDLYRGNFIDLTSSDGVNHGDLNEIDRLTINGRSDASNVNSDFAMAELIVFTDKLNLAEIQCIEDYFLNKYFQTGCDDDSSARVIIADKVYACPGIIKSGGIYGSDAESLCAPGYHVCEGSNELQGLGFTRSMCSNDVARNENEFFATKETSAGNGQCYSVYGGDGIGRDDIWGCATTTSVPDINKDKICGVLEYWIGNSAGFAGWNFGSDNTNEACNLTLTDSSSGGVLCCIDSYVFLFIFSAERRGNQIFGSTIQHQPRIFNRF